MAECIPAQLSPGADPAEKKVHAWLRGLPVDCLVYHEPAVGHRYPDFIVILPTLGLLVIEVKAWKLDRLRRADARDFVFADAAGGLEKPRPAPLRQVREYALKLLNECAEHA